jgi:hypothetical protein
LTEYVCISGPEDEDENDEDLEDDEDDESENKEAKEDKVKIDGEAAGEHPDHKFIVTRATNTLVNKYLVEVAKRDQDLFSCHFYNDFTGYGQQEIIENMLQAVYNEFASKAFDLHRFWVHIEALAVFFYDMRWDLVWCRMLFRNEGFFSALTKSRH